jgi:2-polyprenyl-3-methyl-5-hydroxy-6-metoxy-1,4-benzoquinol methylase
MKAPVDFVHSCTVWEHIDRPRLALQTVFQLLKPGGRACLARFNEIGFRTRKVWYTLDCMVLVTCVCATCTLPAGLD